MTARKPAKKQRNAGSKPRRTQPARNARPDTKSSAPPLIVGIGASAGGLEAFKTFFAHMPADSGMAFVLVQHLDPHHKSMLVELLRQHTAMPIVEAERRMRVAANRVFVIPPNATLTIKDGTLRVTTPAPAREHRRPIDTFLSSLAEDQGERAVGIILSGSGSDGTLGIRAIKEHGGLTLAQAEFDSQAMSGMPLSAAATGLVDHIVPVQEMPATLVDYHRHLLKVAGRKDADGNRSDAAEHLSAINALVRAGTGHDFSQYKSNTLLRRVQRRMQVLRVDTAPAFIERLRKDPREVDLLFREFLIGVTHFFRDPQAFAALETSVLPKILENKGAEDHVRIWVPGCATGEEVYSIAILMQEAMERHAVWPKIQIFGTDIDDAAVSIARAARYRRRIAGVSSERLERWFVQEGEEHCPVKDVRDMCVFSTHSLVKDPPFSKLDLVSCRNLMIYVDGGLQDRMMRTFHYALRAGGYLFLGQSESVTRNARLFAAVDKKHRIFQRRDISAPSLPDFPLAPPPPPAVPAATRTAPRVQDRIDHGVRRALEKHSPAYVVIDKSHDILRFSGGEIGRYLEPSAGAASLNLLGIVRKTLRPGVRAAVQKAYAAGEPVLMESLAVKIDGKTRSVKLIVEPIAEGGDAGLCIVAFQDLGLVAAAKSAAETPHPDLQALEQELHTTKTQLRATIDELETANEEMKSANEEYQSVNEELQSSNEELETAKEEMQSVNEELQTINAELSSKNDLLTRSNSDFRNLLDSTQIATIFLDDKLRITSFTPGMTDLFHLRDSDRGRPITDIAARMEYADLRRDVAKVMRTLGVVEHEVRLTDEEGAFLMRIRPYRTVDNVIDGTVITFVDITERERYQSAKSELAAIVDSSQDAIIGHTFDGTITSWNAGAEKIFGFPADQALGKPIGILLPETQLDIVPDILKKVKRGERVEHFEIDLQRKDGKRIDVSLTISPIRDSSGNVIAASTVAREFTERKLAEEHKTLLIAELDHRVKNTLTIVASLVSQTAKAAESPEAFADAIEGRIQALSRVHRLLTRSNWDRAELRELVEEELAPYRAENGENIVFGGKHDVVLTPQSTMALAMALHELATNAAKYGALSAEGGRVEVAWKIANKKKEPLLSIEWSETGGPRVEPPTRRGFGSELIERALPYQLEAKVQRDFLADGVRCRIEIPLTASTGYVRSEDDGK